MNALLPQIDASPLSPSPDYHPERQKSFGACMQSGGKYSVLISSSPLNSSHLNLVGTFDFIKIAEIPSSLHQALNTSFIMIEIFSDLARKLLWNSMIPDALIAVIPLSIAPICSTFLAYP